jgi:hypothetical protein
VPRETAHKHWSLGDNMNTIKKNTEALSKEAGLEKTKNMLMSHHQNAG